MKDLLEIIKDELKYVHIEDGSTDAFDRVCRQLNARLTLSSVFQLGVRDGRNQMKNEIRELLGV